MISHKRNNSRKIWCKINYAKQRSINHSQSSLKKFVKHLLNNKLLNNKLRQVIGIPMELDLALFLANLFLYFYKNKWIKKTKRSWDKKGNKICKYF